MPKPVATFTKRLLNSKQVSPKAEEDMAKKWSIYLCQFTWTSRNSYSGESRNFIPSHVANLLTASEYFSPCLADSLLQKEVAVDRFIATEQCIMIIRISITTSISESQESSSIIRIRITQVIRIMCILRIIRIVWNIRIIQIIRTYMNEHTWMNIKKINIK